MRNLKLIALTSVTTLTLLGAPFTSMAASSCNTAAALKNYGITTSGNKSGSCGNTNSSNNSNTQSIINYLNGKTSNNSSCGTTGNYSGSINSNSSCTNKNSNSTNSNNNSSNNSNNSSYNSSTQSIIDYLNGKTNSNSTNQTDSTCTPGQDCTTNTGTTNSGTTNSGTTNNSNSGSASSSGQTTTSSSQYAQQVVNLVNAERAKEGLSPVSVDTKVENAAQTRAQEIVTSFSHTRPNGTSFGTALKAAGVSYNACGENIAYGQKSPEAVMTAWMNSSGHRANIMNANFKYIGVGYYQVNGVNYWVQEFTY